MQIRRGSLIFSNVLARSGQGNYEKWQAQIIELRNSVIKNNLYQTGPLFYKVTNIDSEIYEYTIYIPVNNKLRILDNKDYKFYEEFYIEDGLTLRHCGLDDNIEDTKKQIDICAEVNNIELEEEFYNIYVDVYGQEIIDVFVPIKRELK